jgi:hypothetical protein
MAKAEIHKPLLRTPVFTRAEPQIITPQMSVQTAATVPTRRLFGGSCAYFAATVLTGDPSPPYNGRFFIGGHHKEWDELIQLYQRLCVMAPRDHGKTFFFDFAYPLWQSVRQDNNLGYIFSSTQVQASRILEDIKREIENNPVFASYRPPTTAGRWSSTRIRLRNGSQIVARGFGTRVRGAHPYWIVVDDGLNDETVFSETVRKKQVEYFYTAISNLITPNGQLIVVGTPFHEQDLYADLQRNPRYHFARYQSVNEQTGAALWPERYSVKALHEKKMEIGGIRFAREFQCIPVSDEMSLFPSHLFRGQPTEQPQITLGMPLAFWRERGINQVFMACDFALSSSAGADYTVIWVVGLDDHRNRWLMEIVRGKGLDYHIQKSMITEQAVKYKADLIILESNQAQRIFGDELIRETDLPIKKYETGVEKHALDKGIPSLRLLLENRKFRIPRGDERSIEMTDTWISEMRAFAFDKGKVVSVAAHDDLVMACWLCEQGIAMGAFSADFGDAESGLTEEEERALEEAWLGGDEEESEDETAAVEGNNGGNGRQRKAAKPLQPKPDDTQRHESSLVDDDEVEPGSKFWSARGF